MSERPSGRLVLAKEDGPADELVLELPWESGFDKDPIDWLLRLLGPAPPPLLSSFVERALSLV